MCIFLHLVTYYLSLPMAQNKKYFLSLLLFVTISCLFIHSSASFTTNASTSSCSTYDFANGKSYQSCVDLSVLDSFIHWNFDEQSRNLEIAYRHVNVTPSTWVAWGLNPKSKGMVGTQALVAFQKSDGTMRAFSTPINGYNTKMLPDDLNFNVSDLSASYLDGEIIIFASLVLPNGTTTVNHVWQDGPVSNDLPGMHKVTGTNVQSMATLDLLLGQDVEASSGNLANTRMKLKISHGIINTISWGMMMPLGAVVARYLKVFNSANPAWFKIHRACQSSAYIIGVVGFITGIVVGNFSPGIIYTVHLIIGIILISLASLQVVLAVAFRPEKDHKYRIWWNACHYIIGYSTIGLSIYNIFRGFAILKPRKTWENAYIGYILGLASLAVILETLTWIIVLKRRYAKANEENTNSTKMGDNMA